MSQLGIVAIGRNEGERLVRCLDALLAQAPQGSPLIYVDSGSIDQSCQVARERGVTVVELDPALPFTAARARNAGWQKIQGLVDYVQFVDGDCELVAGWLMAAIAVLEQQPEVVAVCGWRRERFPEHSWFNRICDVEWRLGAIGPTFNLGGDVMVRISALAAVGGYREQMIAGEDEDLGVRLRQTGGVVWRLDRDCTLHDVAMDSPVQWWQRAVRSGYAYALVSCLHGASPERKFVKEMWRIWLWGAIVPLSALVLAPLTHGLSLLAFLRYPLSALRIIYRTYRQGWPFLHSLAWGFSCVLIVFPGVIGATKFQIERRSNQSYAIIEYK